MRLSGTSYFNSKKKKKFEVYLIFKPVYHMVVSTFSINEIVFESHLYFEAIKVKNPVLLSLTNHSAVLLNIFKRFR